MLKLQDFAMHNFIGLTSFLCEHVVARSFKGTTLSTVFFHLKV